jgi:hypothetical protein
LATVIDYAGGVPAARLVKQAGHIGAVRYLSDDRTRGSLPAKPIKKVESDDYRANDLELAFVWQYGKDHDSDVMRGRAGGLADAREADNRLKALGRDNYPVFFAVDFDITLEQWNQTAVHYFRACCEVLGRERVGIYGHSRVIDWAVEDGVVADLGDGKHLLWQTVAWSRGVRHEKAVLFQRAGNPLVDGVPVDVNEVLHTYWGQRPFAKSVLLPAPKVRREPLIKPNPNHRGDPLFLADLLRAFGLNVIEWPGWKERGHGDFDKIQGLVVHHTGTVKDIPGYIANHPQLGLCSQIHLNRNGDVVLVGVGIAYHAGLGDKDGWPRNAANMVSIGIEAASDGLAPWPQEQLYAYHVCCAAILWYLGYNATPKHLISHEEYSRIAQGKWDPGAGIGQSGVAIEMNRFRREVQKYIDNPPIGGDWEDAELMAALDEVHKSIVTGSDYKAPLKQMIVNADGHSYVARQAAEDNQRQLAEVKKELAEHKALLSRIAEKIGV